MRGDIFDRFSAVLHTPTSKPASRGLPECLEKGAYSNPAITPVPRSSHLQIDNLVCSGCEWSVISRSGIVRNRNQSALPSHLRSVIRGSTPYTWWGVAGHRTITMFEQPRYAAQGLGFEFCSNQRRSSDGRAVLAAANARTLPDAKVRFFWSLQGLRENHRDYYHTVNCKKSRRNSLQVMLMIPIQEYSVLLQFPATAGSYCSRIDS